MSPKILLLLSGMMMLGTSLAPVFAGEEVIETSEKVLKFDSMPGFTVSPEGSPFKLTFTGEGLDKAQEADNGYAITIKSYLNEIHRELTLAPAATYSLEGFIPDDFMDYSLFTVLVENDSKKESFYKAFGLLSPDHPIITMIESVRILMKSSERGKTFTPGEADKTLLSLLSVHGKEIADTLYNAGSWKNELETREKSHSKLEDEKLSLEAKQAELEKRIKELTKDLEAKTASESAAAAEILKIKKDHENNLGKFTEIEKTLKSLHASEAEKTNQIEVLKGLNEGLKTKVSEGEKDLTDKDLEILRLKNKLASTQEKVVELTKVQVEAGIMKKTLGDIQKLMTQVHAIFPAATTEE